MVRTRGARNEDYEAKRRLLLESLRQRLRQPGPAPSERDLAAAAGITVPTLKHYFGDRAGVLRAIFEDEFRIGNMPGGPLHVASLPTGAFADSVRDALVFLDAGLVFGGLMHSHALGLTEGFQASAAADAYVSFILDPTVDAIAKRLRLHQERGEMVDTADARIAALQLVSPLIFGRIHQNRLGGNESNPLSINALIDQCSKAFVASYAAPPA